MEGKSMRALVAALLVASAFNLAAPTVSAQDRQLDPYITLLRTDLKAQRAALIINNMEFTEAESAVFWPVYHQYQHEMTQVGNHRVALITDYLAHFDRMDDEKAKELTAKAVEVEEQRLAVMKKYVGEFAKVLPAKQVARLFQLELQMERLVDVQISAQLPLLK
jgi:Spy/CpxP family protein refolding chaperone